MKLPLFETLRKYIYDFLAVCGVSEPKRSDYRDRLAKPSYFIALIVMIFSPVIGVTTLFKHEKSDQTYLSTKYEPPKAEVSYWKTNETKNSDSMLWLTTFKLSIHQPAGNYDRGFNPKANIVDAECGEWKPLGGVTETIGNYSSSTTYIEVTCKSKTELIDTGNLFTVVGVK